MDSLLRLQMLEMEGKPSSSAVKTEIQQLRETIPTPILDHYDRLRQRGKKGVAIVQKGVCAECHVGLAIGVMATLRHGDDVQLCGNCGRYLHLPEDETIKSAPPTIKTKPAGKKRNANPPVHVH